MTKISTKSVYPIKKPVKSDYFVGSNSENFGQTVNFDFNDATKVINSINGESPISYKFKTSGNILLDVLTEAEFYSLDNQVSISSITKLYINKFTKDALNLTNLYNYLLVNSSDFLFKLRGTDPNIFVYFDLTSIENHSDYYLFNVALYKGNSSFSTLTSFSDYFFSFELKSVGSGGSGGSDPLKLDKASYSGNATDIDNRIIALESVNNIQTNFTGQAFAVWSGVGLIFDVIYPNYYINGVLYNGATTTITLSPSDTSYDRLDIIAVDSTGVIKVTGTPATNPLIPTIDLSTQIEITTVLINANATIPSNVIDKPVYKENIEFATYSNNGTVNFNGTSAFQGVKCIDCGAFNNTQYLRFTDSVLNQTTDSATIKFNVYLKSAFTTTTGFYINFYNGAILSSSLVQITDKKYNFSKSVTGSWQTVIVPLSAFTFRESQFDTVKIGFLGSNSVGFKIDNIILSKGTDSPTPLQNTITTIVTDSGVVNSTTNDDTITFTGTSGLGISAIGKVITFTSLFTATLKGYYDTAYSWVSANGANVVSHLSRTDNPHSVTKAQVGLGNVDNTSDANKPVSTAQATADTAILSSANAYTDGKVSSVYKFKGNVANYASLPSTSLTIGDVYNLTDTGANYAWTGTIWDNLGVIVDISGKQDTLVSGTNIKTVNGATILGSGDIVISGGNSNPYSLKHFKTYFSAIIGYTASGFTPTYSDGKMVFTGGGGNFSQYLTIDNLKNTDENLEIEVVFKAISSGYGVGIGKRSFNSWYNASVAMTCSVSQNSIYLWDSAVPTMINSKAVSTIATNDIIKIKLTQIANVITCTYYNLTTGVVTQFSSIGNLSTTKNFKIPNSSDLVVYNLGGTNHIISIKATSFSNYKPDILVIGDSKSVGYSAKSNSLRWANNIGSLGTVIVNAGDGDRTVEATQTINYTKLINAKYAIIAIGRNDLGSGVVSGTWQTNYANIVTQLQGQGTTVFHLLPIPETSLADQSALNTWIIATYGSGNCIDIATGWSNATMLSSDTVHPNEVGHAFISKKIIDSGLIAPTSPVQILSKNNEVENITTNAVTINSANYIPYSDGTNLQNTSVFRAGAKRIGQGTTTPYDYGSTFESYEILGTIYGLYCFGKIGSLIKFYFSGGGDGTSPDVGSFGVNNNGSFKNAYTVFPSGNVSFDVNGAITDKPSAKVAIDSTTQGFLPPRMTNTQRLAISSPAIGLMVYCTDTTEGLYIYKSTGWTFII